MEHYLLHEIEWNNEFIRKRTLKITVFDVRQVEIRYCGGSACVGIVTRNGLKGSRGVRKVVHDTVLSPSINRTRVHGCLCGVSVCVVPQNVRNSTLRQLWGTHCMKTVEEEGPGWWVGTLWCPCGAPLTNERRMPVELCIGGNKRSRKSILLLVTAPEVRNV